MTTMFVQINYKITNLTELCAGFMPWRCWDLQLRVATKIFEGFGEALFKEIMIDLEPFSIVSRKEVF